jgi:hypothetical protein
LPLGLPHSACCDKRILCVSWLGHPAFPAASCRCCAASFVPCTRFTSVDCITHTDQF